MNSRLANKSLISTKPFTLLCILLISLSGLQSAWSQPYQRSPVLDENISFATIKFDNQQMHYAFAGDATKPGVLFIHGTPGSWGAFETYLENPTLQQAFFMVSVDRLGWGLSEFAPGHRISGRFDLQAEGIAQVMANYPEKKWILVGHSLGASLAPQVALAEPNKVSALLLLAGSLKPKLGKPRWYNRIANTWLVSKLIGSTMTDSNREIIGLRKQLTAMDKAVQATQLDVKLVVMQGMKDKLVSPKNPAYVAEHWGTNFSSIELIELSQEGHFLPWRQTPLVIETIRKLAGLTTPAIQSTTD